jgi:GT2 family glycosyltransferase
LLNSGQVEEEEPEDEILYKRPKNVKRIADIVIPHHDRHDLLCECLENIDNSRFHIHIESGGTFAENCNKGAEKAKTDTIIFLNDDTVPNSDQLEEVAKMDADIVGIAQTIDGNEGVLYGINFKITEAGELKGYYAKTVDEALIPCGVAFAVKKKVWDKLKLNERFRNGGEDSDFGIRALLEGYSIEFYEKPIQHHHSQSEGSLAYSRENQILLNTLWNNKETRKVLFGKMKILVATNHLDRLGGSETYTYSMVKELERLGHNVEVFTFTKDKVGVQAKLNVVDKPKDRYDLIFINHNTCLMALQDVQGYKVFTSHGVFPEIEQPVAGADKYVSISSEVKAHLRSLEFNSELILNGIDCDRFKPKTKIRKKPKKVLSICQGEVANQIIEKACKKLKLDFEKLDKTVWNVEDKINEADIVFSLGRGAYEAMACGRDVIIFDSRAYMGFAMADGRVNKSNINEIIKNNCSGRRYEKEWGVEDVVRIIKFYNQNNGEFNRKFAIENLNIKKQVDKYLQLCEK